MLMVAQNAVVQDCYCDVDLIESNYDTMVLVWREDDFGFKNGSSAYSTTSE